MDASTAAPFQGSTHQSLPLKARIILSHAHLEELARVSDIDVLHIKGYAFGSDTYPDYRKSTDVDVLVRPDQVDDYVAATLAAGWQVVTHFETGSDYHHAMTIYHPTWGLADIHRAFPGLGKDPALTFELLWKNRRTKILAHYPCTTTGLLDSRLIVYIHSARSTSSIKSDVDYLDSLLTDREKEELRQRVSELDAELAFAAATGSIDDYADHPDYLFWKTASEKTAVMTRWYARFKASEGLKAKVQLLGNIIWVNRDHLTMELGREPGTADLLYKFFSRFQGLLPASLRRKK